MGRPGRPLSPHTPALMIAAYDAWRRTGTLRKAAAQLGLSHERVRQLVSLAVQHGVVPALPSKDSQLPPNPFPDRSTTITVLKQYGTLAAVSRATGYPLQRLHRHARRYGLHLADLLQLYRLHRKHVVAIRRYIEVCARFGYHPTTTELQAFPEGNKVDRFIRRHWGSIEAFRSAYRIVLHGPLSRAVPRQTAA